MKNFIIVAALLSACLFQPINGRPQWRTWFGRSNNYVKRNNGMLQALTGPYQPRTDDSWQQWGSHNLTSNSKPASFSNGSAQPYNQVPGARNYGGSNGRNFSNSGQNVAQTNFGWVNPASNGVGFRPSPSNHNGNVYNNSAPQNQWNTNGNSYPNWNAQRPANGLINGSNVQNAVVGNGGAYAPRAPLNDSRSGGHAQSWNAGSSIFGFPGSAPIPTPHQSQSGGFNSGNVQLAPLAGSQGGGFISGNVQLAPLAGSQGVQRQAPSNYPAYSNPYANRFLI